MHFYRNSLEHEVFSVGNCISKKITFSFEAGGLVPIGVKVDISPQNERAKFLPLKKVLLSTCINFGTQIL